MYFIQQSLVLTQKKLCEEWQLRRERFDNAKTPKRVFSFWFFVFVLGQIGIITSALWAGVAGEGIMEALAKQGRAGNFLTFEISLLLSCLVYYFEEYGEEPVRALFFLRVTLLILGMSIAFLAMVNYIYINSVQSPAFWPDWFVVYNLLLYVTGIILSYFMYITFSVVETSVSDVRKERTETAQSTAKNIQETKETVIGDKKINL